MKRLLLILPLLFWLGCEDKEEEPTLIGDWALSSEPCNLFFTGDVFSFNSDGTFNKNGPINSDEDEDTFNGTWSLKDDTLFTVYENFGNWTWDCQLSNKMMTLTPLIAGAGNEVDWNCISNFSKM
jgi:hypothetical protein